MAPALADYAFCADCYERRAATADFSRVAEHALALMRAESQLLFPANTEVRAALSSRQPCCYGSGTV
jgi:hypothetical protein